MMLTSRDSKVSSRGGAKAEDEREELLKKRQILSKVSTLSMDLKNDGDGVGFLRWGRCKRSRLFKGASVQRTDKVYSSAPRSADGMQHKPAGATEVSQKGETENSCIDHQSPSSEKSGKDCRLAEKDVNKSSFSPCRNGQTRRRTELDSLHEMKEVDLAASKWPRVLISLSHKEKEDDFMVMKGSRLPQRPRKRAKHVEKFVAYASPGLWLCEVSLDRYEVREKKSQKRKPAGLKAMESLDSDSS